MAKETVGELIRKARTDAGLTQEQLASKVADTSAADISKAERGQKILTQVQLKEIAKATGVTQKSLLEAPAGSGSDPKKDAETSSSRTDTSKTGNSKTGSSKTGSSKTGSSKTGSSKTGSSKTGSCKTGSSSSSSKAGSMKLTKAEIKLVELYRKADSKTKKAAVELLENKQDQLSSLLTTLLGGSSQVDVSSVMDTITGLFGKR